MKTVTKVAMLLMCTALLALPALAAEDAACADTSDCGGMCSTCPGKASAMKSLAEVSKVVFAVDGLKADAATGVREALGGVDGVQIAVADAEGGVVWVAYENPATPAGLVSELSTLGLTVTRTDTEIDPLPALASGHERAVVYVAMLGCGDCNPRIMEAFAGMDGVDACRLDAMFNMLLVDYDPSKVGADEFKNKVLDLGYAVGMPGEHMAAPEEPHCEGCEKLPAA